MSSLIDRIKEKLDLVDYASRFTTLKRVKGEEYTGLCPFHKETQPSFRVNRATQRWRCFGACATGGTIIDFVMRLKNCGIEEAITYLAAEAGIERERPISKKLTRIYETLDAALKIYRDKLDGSPAKEHLKRRGLLEAASRFDLGYAPAYGIGTLMTERGFSVQDRIDAGLLTTDDNGNHYDLFRNRLIIPLRDSRGRVVGFAGRALTPEQQPKFLNTPKTAVFDRHSILFGFDRAKDTIRMEGRAVIVEGYFDVIEAHLRGYMDVVAAMGTGLTQAQVELVKGQSVIVALDGDKAGQAASVRAVRELLTIDKDIKVAILSGDPDEVMKAGEWERVLADAKPAVEYVIEQRLSELPEAPTFHDRQRAATELLEIIHRNPNRLLQHYHAEQIASRLGLHGDEILTLVEKKPMPSAVPSVERSLSLLTLSILLHEGELTRLNEWCDRIGIDPPDADDFDGHSDTWRIVHAAHQQFDADVLDYARQYIDLDPSTGDVCIAFGQLRLDRIARELDSASLDRAAELLDQKSRILFSQP